MKFTPIRMRRINAGLESQKAIELLNISQSAFYKLEQGRMQPGPKLIKRLSETYKCTIDEIFKDLKITG